MSTGTDAHDKTPSHVVEGGLVALLDPHAVEEGRAAAIERTRIGAPDGESETAGLVTRDVVTARLAVLEDARGTALDELAVIQGKIIGLREVLAADSASA
ncbi:MAG: hypothetical protein ACJ72D_09710 [Marmoricola sp.]